MPSLIKCLSLNLPRFRKDRGLTQGDLAKLSGLTRGAIAKYEGGTGGATLDSIAKLANALDVEETDLVATGTILSTSTTRAAPASIDSSQGEGLPHPPGSMSDRKTALIAFILHATPAQLEQMEVTAQLEKFAADADQSNVGNTSTPRKRSR